MRQETDRRSAEEQRVSLLVAPGRAGSPGAGALRNAVILLAVLLTTAATIGNFLYHTPSVRLEGEGATYVKHRYFSEHRDEFDLVFLGSSRVYRELDPEEFDRVAAERGVDVRSFNFGAPGVNAFEMMYAVEWILDREPARLRWLVLELGGFNPHIREENRLGRRDIHWHTPRLTWAALRATSDMQKRGLWEKLALGASHAEHGFYRLGNLGVALPAIRGMWFEDAYPPMNGRPRSLQGYRGHQNLEDALGEALARGRGSPQSSTGTAEVVRIRKRRDDYLADPHALEEKQDRMQRRAGSREPEAYEEELLLELVALIRSRGVEPVFFQSPSDPQGNQKVRWAAENGVLPIYLDYNNPDRFQECTDPLLQFDHNHLNARGARLFTRRLASDFAEYATQFAAEQRSR